jgi:hypothetical protein
MTLLIEKKKSRTETVSPRVPRRPRRVESTT